MPPLAMTPTAYTQEATIPLLALRAYEADCGVQLWLHYLRTGKLQQDAIPLKNNGNHALCRVSETSFS